MLKMPLKAYMWLIYLTLATGNINFVFIVEAHSWGAKVWMKVKGWAQSQENVCFSNHTVVYEGIEVWTPELYRLEKNLPLVRSLTSIQEIEENGVKFELFD